MSPFKCFLFSGVMLAALSPGLIASSAIESQFDAPAWRVDYEIEFRSDATRPRAVPQGEMSVQTRVENRFKAAKLLDMRNAGSNLLMTRMSLASGDAGALGFDPMSFGQMIMEASEYMANWMNSGMSLEGLDENAGYEAVNEHSMGQMRGAAVPAYLAFEEIITGRGLLHEMGDTYDLDSRSKAEATASVVPGMGGGSDVMLELDKRNGKYSLTLPLSYANVDMAMLDVVTDEHVTPRGQAAWDHQKTERLDFVSIPRIAVADPRFLLGPMFIIEGQWNGGTASISGEHSIAAHHRIGQEDLPGTLLVRYTLTPVNQP